MATFKDLSKRTLEDLRNGRHREAYALFLIGAVLAVLGLIGVADVTVLLSAILLALSFLVFHTAAEASGQPLELDEVLRSREDFGPFSKLLLGTRDLRIYGPTAVNVLVNSADIRRFVLNTGGTVKVIVQDRDRSALALVAAQLDDNLDLESTLSSSLAILNKLAREPGFAYRRLSAITGFSLVIVNAADPDGYVIFESHGFKDDNITDRMHIVIRKRESPRWFLYWLSRFDAMWEAAKPPASQISPVTAE
ncbi:MAG: hypothetical protein ACHP9Z_01180 [Streptosporangiales bacterium]